MQPDFHRGLLKSKEYSQPLADISDDIARSLRFEHNTPSLPIEILDVVGKDHAGDPTDGRQWNLEWITFHLTRDGAGDCQSCFRVVSARREDQRRAPAALLVTSLRIKRQPNQIAGVRYVGASYHASPPTAELQSLSSWRFRGVIRATSCSRE